jgi:sortase (surface protein transpeptidase)
MKGKEVLNMKQIVYLMVSFALIVQVGCTQNSASVGEYKANSMPDSVQKQNATINLAQGSNMSKSGAELDNIFQRDLSGLPTLQEVQQKGIIPAKLQIPAIKLNATVEQVGIQGDGEMEAPESFETVGWLGSGSKPGASGNAVIAGHLDHYTGPAVFLT